MNINLVVYDNLINSIVNNVNKMCPIETIIISDMLRIHG